MKSAIKLSYALIFLLFFAGCSDDEVVNVNLDTTKILSLVNENRAAGATCGSNKKAAVSSLQWSDELAKAALDHSNDMQQNDYFDHTSQDGRKFSERAKNAGYTGSPVGENIANGYRSEESVMQGWMESAGHCKNIMSSNATHLGVAKSTDGYYWTMVLGRE